jgi:hypothetical protein
MGSCGRLHRQVYVGFIQLPLTPPATDISLRYFQMLKIYNCIATEHDLRLVGLAAFVCLLASFTAINLLRHARKSTGQMRSVWLTVSAISAGFGIWATDFVAMLAFAPGLPSGNRPSGRAERSAGKVEDRRRTAVNACDLQPSLHRDGCRVDYSRPGHRGVAVGTAGRVACGGGGDRELCHSRIGTCWSRARYLRLAPFGA